MSKVIELRPMQTHLPGMGYAGQSFVSTRNACKLCAPLGASIVFRGIEGCIPLIHGSQGCSTYIRRYLISHYKEPIDIASSNFTETTAIFGGGDNLKKALDNIIRQYNPTAIGIATTCLSETIGDDVNLYLRQYHEQAGDKALPAIIHASTPSYSGTHMEGFHAAVSATVRNLARACAPHAGVNILPGFVSTADLRHLKDVLDDFGLPYAMLPDYSETFDGESWEEYQKLSAGGTPVASIKAMAGAAATLQLGDSLTGQKDTAGSYLEKTFGVKLHAVGLPIGMRQTDRFFEALEAVSGRQTPARHASERGRLVDAYIDAHKYVFGRRAIIYGEIDFVASMASFLDEIGMVPVLCATGASTNTFKGVVEPLVSSSGELIHIVEDTDFATMLDTGRELQADIVIGNSKGYYLAKRLGLPMVRAGFPIHDRIGGQRIQHLGYAGTQQLFDRIVNTLIERRQDTSSVGYSYM